MPVLSRLIAAVLLGFMASPVQAADAAPRACLTKAEQRAAVADRRAIPLAEAIRLAHRHRKGELVRARLCRRGDRLVYVLTLLPRSGKVMQVTVDAANGELITGR